VIGNELKREAAVVMGLDQVTHVSIGLRRLGDA
jgi:hypothetical protein